MEPCTKCKTSNKMLLKNSYILLALAIALLPGCEPKPAAQQDPIVQDVVQDDIEVKVVDSAPSKADEQEKNGTISVMIIPCSNGYEYAMHGYDFNPIIEHELGLLHLTEVQVFPLKKMMGVAYHGVFDKRYCAPIIERADVDYLIMTRFIGNQNVIGNDVVPSWGYETKVLNTKTMEQVNSIRAENLKSYADIETRIKENIALLRQDIEELS